MKRVVQTIQIKDDPEIQRKYREYHDNAWPEVIESLREIGIDSLEIYLLGRRLVMVMETADDFDGEKQFAIHYNRSEKIREWEDMMKSFQEPVPESPGGDWWAPMERVFKM